MGRPRAAQPGDRELAAIGSELVRQCGGSVLAGEWRQPVVVCSLRWLRCASRAGVQPDLLAGPAPTRRRTRVAGGDDRHVTTLSELAAAGDAIAQTSSKSEKVRLLAQFLAATSEDELAQAARYFGGSVFPTGDQRTLQVGGAAFSTVL